MVYPGVLGCRQGVQNGVRLIGLTGSKSLNIKATNWPVVNGFKSGIILPPGCQSLATTSSIISGSTAAASHALLQPSKPLGFWLLGVAGAVFGMVVLGGVTRLTRSGLSMVDWKLQGRPLPRTEDEWKSEFEKYKQYPEYKRINKGMDLDEFKEIYFLEWAHRMWGRGLGVIYGLPLAYFLLSGKSSTIPGINPKLGALLCLGAAQGLVGWWMVKSGLEESPDVYKDPRVSPYRLAAHLTAALTLYTGLIWTGLTALNPNRIVSPSNAVVRMRSLGLVALGFTGITFFSGAFVAGNDAGRAYNDWPLYAGKIIPDEIWDSSLHPSWRNIFENTATVQFDHRNLAYTTAIVVLGTVLRARSPQVWKHLPRHSQIGFYGLGAALATQVTLGISTLMMFVPVSLGAAHQAGALTLWTVALYCQHALRYIR